MSVYVLSYLSPRFRVGGAAPVTGSTTQTQSGTARIQVSTTRTQTGVSRIALITTRTQTGVSKITASATRTQTGVSNISAFTTRAQPGTARVTISTTRTQTGVSRISINTTRTQTGRSRISINTTRTQTGTARITISTTRTQPGHANIKNNTIKTQTGVANIVTRTVYGSSVLVGGTLINSALGVSDTQGMGWFTSYINSMGNGGASGSGSAVEDWRRDGTPGINFQSDNTVIFKSTVFQWRGFNIIGNPISLPSTATVIYTVSVVEDTFINDYKHTGLYVKNINGVPTLFGWYYDKNGVFRSVKSTDGVSFTEKAITDGTNPSYTGFSATTGVGKSVWYHGCLHTNAFKIRGSVKYNPASDQLAFCDIASGTSYWTPGADFAIGNDRLFKTAYTGASSVVQNGNILRLKADESGWETQITSAAVFAVSIGMNYPGNMALFNGEDGYLYSLWSQSAIALHTTPAVQAYKHTLSSGSVSDIITVPTSVTWPMNATWASGDSGYVTAYPRLSVYVDQASGPGLSPTLTFNIQVFDTGALNYRTTTLGSIVPYGIGEWFWNGPTNPVVLPPLATSDGAPIRGFTPYQYPNQRDGGGERVLDLSNKGYGVEFSRAPVPDPVNGGMIIYFRLYDNSVASSSGRKFGLFFGTNNYSAHNKCTLTNPSGGGLITVGGQIFNNGLTADGSTEYYVTWQAANDGVSSGDKVSLLGYVL